MVHLVTLCFCFQRRTCRCQDWGYIAAQQRFPKWTVERYTWWQQAPRCLILFCCLRAIFGVQSKYRQHVHRHKVGAPFGQNMEIDTPSVIVVHTAGVATVPSAPVRSLHHLTIRPYRLILRWSEPCPYPPAESALPWKKKKKNGKKLLYSLVSPASARHMLYTWTHTHADASPACAIHAVEEIIASTNGVQTGSRM